MRALLLAASLLAAPAFAETDYGPAVKADYDSHLRALFEDFHRNPELSFLETRTAAIMAKELRAAGATVTEEVGGTGVVGVMRNGDGPVVLLRADMDGLPVAEPAGLSYASKAVQKNRAGVEMPVMHACGHDVHITAMIGAARRLAAMKDRWKGTILFVVQPAEEIGSGARAMVEDGLYTRFPKPEYALAFHVAAELPTGMTSAAETLMWSSVDSVDIIVRGVGAHGAAPDTGRDPVYIGAQIVTALQSVVSREINPLKPAVVTVGSFHAGTKHNIISDRAELQLTLRANDEDTRGKLKAAVERIAKNVARAHGIAEDKLPEVRFSEAVPTTINDAGLARRMNALLASTFGTDRFRPFVQEDMGGEDFGYFASAETGVKGYYFVVGGTPQAAFDAARAGGPPVPSHHSPLFKIDPEPSVRLGAEAMVAATLDLMKPGQ